MASTDWATLARHRRRQYKGWCWGAGTHLARRGDMSRLGSSHTGAVPVAQGESADGSHSCAVVRLARGATRASWRYPCKRHGVGRPSAGRLASAYPRHRPPSRAMASPGGARCPRCDNSPVAGQEPPTAQGDSAQRAGRRRAARAPGGAFQVHGLVTSLTREFRLAICGDTSRAILCNTRSPNLSNALY